MKILILGCNGQLGRDMMVMCQEKGIESYGYDFPNIDITERQSIERVVKNVRPSTIINCVAYTAVDVAETDINRAFAVNAVGGGKFGVRSFHVGYSSGSFQYRLCF